MRIKMSSYATTAKLGDTIDNSNGKCHVFAMKSTVVVDEFGRLVLPKSVRAAMGIFGRTPLMIEVVGEKAELAAAEPVRTEVKRKSGRTVYAGPVPDQWDSGAAVLEARARRLGRT